MFDVDLIRHRDRTVTVIGSEPGLETEEEAREAGRRIYASRAKHPDPNYPTANGYRVRKRGSGETVYVWTEGEPDHA